MAIVFALALLGMAVTAVLVLDDRADDRDTDGTGSLPRPGVLFRAQRLGVVGVRPASWHVERSRRAIRLSGSDRAALVGVSATPSSVGARALMSSALATVRGSYRRVRLGPVRLAQVGGIAGRTSGGTVTNSRGVRVDLSIATAKGKRRTYLLQVFVARKAAGRRLAEAQRIVDSLELSG